MVGSTLWRPAGRQLALEDSPWFRDPLARRLAGGRVGGKAQAMAFASSKVRAHVARIVLIDRFTADVGVGGATENGGWL